MRVAVLGAGGTIAPAIVRDLAASEEVVAMRLLDLDLRRAEAVAIEHGGGKAEAYEVDATLAWPSSSRASTCSSTPPPTASTST